MKSCFHGFFHFFRDCKRYSRRVGYIMRGDGRDERTGRGCIAGFAAASVTLQARFKSPVVGPGRLESFVYGAAVQDVRNLWINRIRFRPDQIRIYNIIITKTTQENKTYTAVSTRKDATFMIRPINYDRNRMKSDYSEIYFLFDHHSFLTLLIIGPHIRL